MESKEDKIIKHYWLYALQLEDDKYYIGISSRTDPYKRVEQHMNGFYSAQWTKKHKPIKAVEMIDIGNITKADADQQELKRTLQYMKKYGLQNVRGGILNYSGNYVKIGSRFIRDEEWKIIVALLFIMSALLILILKAIKK